MSAFNVGKKVSAAVRILQRKRDASARATHLVGKKYPLITYEKALLSQATGGKFPSVTFIERKQMSTKTSIKRIALVAAAALTLGGFSAVSANATAYTATATWSVSSAYYGAGTGFTSTTASSAGSQIVSGTAKVALQLVTAVNATGTTSGPTSVNIVSTGVGAITAANNNPSSPWDNSTHPIIKKLGGGAAIATTDFPGTGFTAVQGTTGADTETLEVSVFSQVAGTQTLTATTLNSDGSPVKTYTATITWIATGSGFGAVASQSTMYISNIACTYGTSHASDLVSTSAKAAIKSASTSETDYICIVARDANGVLMNVGTPTIYASMGATVGSVTGGSAGKPTATITDANSLTGATTITAILIDSYSNVLTLSTPLSYYGTLSTLSLANYNGAAAKGGHAEAGTDASVAAASTGKDALGASTSALGALLVVAKDSNGNVIDLSASGQGNSVSSFTIDSDANTGAPTAKTSDSAGAVVNMSTSAAGDDISPLAFGANVALVNCASSTKAEKLSITVHGKDKNGTTVSSNAVTFYCSTSAKTVSVAAASASIDAGATTTLTATVTDAQGYPVADGTAVTFASTGQGTVAPSSGATWGGVAGTTDTNLVNFIAAGDGGAATVTAIAGNYSGTTTISVAGGSGSSSLSLDAANAATDAANNAYDEAQNATQAASDALAAVTALSAQVGALIATVKSLAAVVAKIKAKVKA